uniref:DOMON domain-containing protein n=1 Tax=Anopheles quadriannulatus TaxID=34691 RepID=A0A182WX47_ANOQN
MQMRPMRTTKRDRHVKKHGDGEPLVDSSQDYVLLLGYENQTHTVLRFKRKLDTCDVAYDVPITWPVFGVGRNQPASEDNTGRP